MERVSEDDPVAERETLAEEDTRGDLLALLDPDEHCETEAVADAE